MLILRKTLLTLMNLTFLVTAFTANAADGPISLPMTSSSFKLTLDHLNTRLQPIVQQRYGKHYLATGDWNKPYSPTSLGGSFYHPIIPGVARDDAWGVHIVGWLAKWPDFTSDTMELVLCHELGHHIYGGGEEVEADHFTPSCLRWLWTDLDNAEWFKNQNAKHLQEFRQTCSGAADIAQRNFCLRVLHVLPALENFREWVWAKMEIPRLKIAEGTACRRSAFINGLRNGPVPECRL